MVNTKLEEYKLRRELKRSGRMFEFLRNETNKFKEQTGDQRIVGSIQCIYHEKNGSVQITTGESTQVRSKKVPMLLCLYSDVKEIDLKVGDQVKFNEKTFNVTGIVNIQEWNIIADITLEVVDIGVPA